MEKRDPANDPTPAHRCLVCGEPVPAPKDEDELPLCSQHRPWTPTTATA